MPEIGSMGASIVAICPQRPEFLKQMRSDHGLGFDILRDEGNAVAEEFGLKWTFPDYLRGLYEKEFGIDIARLNGDGEWALPMPARYVVRQNGTVAAADLDADYRYRPEPAKTLEDIEGLTKG